MESMEHTSASHRPDPIYTSIHRDVHSKSKPARLYALMYKSAFLLILLCCLTACIETSPITSKPAEIIQNVGTFKEYPLPQANSGLMRPAIDQQGRIWFGEMGQNYLASFDPDSQTFIQITPPGGQAGIMGVMVAPDDTIWFAEQNADYIGHYNPTTKHFTTYALPQVTTPDPENKKQRLNLPSAPNELIMDQHGNIWFTEMNADTIGKLQVKTGVLPSIRWHRPQLYKNSAHMVLRMTHRETSGLQNQERVQSVVFQ